jgi:acrylyl-CoA reductase (NADPH)
MERFEALVLRKDEETDDGGVSCRMETLVESALGDGEVLVKVAYSSLNYKDALAVTGTGAIVKTYPMVPGIDLSGIVVKSASPDYVPGDKVIVTGWGIGERYWGGFSEYARVRVGWLTRLPEGLTLKRSMAAGTAGLTGMLSVMELERQGVAEGSAVVVTGASGGVGSIAVGLLAELGARVTASTGRRDEHEAFLRELGASEVIDRSMLSGGSKPLEKQSWAGAVDTVGGSTLSGVLSRMAYGGAVAACGLAGGHELHATVFPFILRGVKLIGIDSVMCPAEIREQAWRRIAAECSFLDAVASVVPFREVVPASFDLLNGQLRGRTVVAIDESLNK